MNEDHFSHGALSIEECRKLMKETDMSDAEIEEFLRALRSYLSNFLDDYFESEFEPIEV
jgi:hypothetical protein